ncbi:MAG: hypothetical protein J5502_01075 [Prevotella sp.]|nr:hypothetical protein [Prevotella sp.]
MAICIQKVFGAPCETITAQDFEAVLDDPAVAETYRTCRDYYHRFEQLRDSGETAAAKAAKTDYDAKKKTLAGWIFSCSGFIPHEWVDTKGNNHGVDTWRHQEYGLLNGLFMVDLDHLDDPLATWKMLLAHPRFVSYYQPRLMFAFMTPSGRGLKIVMKCNLEDGNLASAQNRFCRELGLPNDKSTKDSSRLSFVCPRSEVLYYDAALHDYQNEAWIARYKPVYAQALSEPDLFADDGQTLGDGSFLFDNKSAVTGQTKKNRPQLFDDYRYEGLEIPAIIDKWLEHFDTSVGKRHKVLLRLVSELRHVCERNEERVKYFVNRLPWVEDLRREGDPVDKTIEDGLSYKLSMTMPKVMYQTLKSLGASGQITRTDTPEGRDAATQAVYDEVTPVFMDFGREIERLSQDFPCLAEVCYHMATPQKPACLFVGGALFGTLMTRCYYYFYHRPETVRRLNYEVFVIEDPASGKSFASDLYKIILSPVIAADAVGNKAINDYKKESKKRDKSIREQKKDALVQPEVKIRIHGSRTSNQTFIEDMVNCYELQGDGSRVNLHLFTFDSELENNTRLGGSSQAWIDKSVFELKAFHNEEDDQQYKNVDSVSGPFDVYWNFVYTGTPVSLSKKVNIRNFGSGLYSRMAVLPLCSDAFEVIPLYRRSKENIDVIDRLKAWAFKLDQTRGELPFWPLVEHTYYWMADIMELAKMEEDRITAMLVKRVPYYGLNVAAPFIVMRHWEEWQQSGTFKIDEKDKALCSVILEIQLYTQKKFFGGQAKTYYENKYADEQSNKVNYYSKSDRLLESLPTEFTKEKLMEFANMNEDVARVQIWRWVKDKKVEKSGRGKTAKIKKLAKTVTS